jgi:APA family basic amino acid/polyamine antiporter
VAIAWSGYFNSLLTGFGVHLPDYLTHGYRTALLSSDPVIHALLQTAPSIAGVPLLINVPAFVIVMLITWLLYVGVKESVRANNIMVVVKLIVLSVFVIVGGMHIDTANYVPFAPNGWRGIHQGAAIVFFAYIGLTPSRLRPKRPGTPRTCRSGFSGVLQVHGDLRDRGAGGDRVPYQQLGSPTAGAGASTPTNGGWFVAFGAVVADRRAPSFRWPAANLLRQRRRAVAALGREDPPGYRTPHITTPSRVWSCGGVAS